MSDYLLSRLEASPDITIHYNASMTALQGETGLAEITVQDSQSGATPQIPTRAVFVMVGAAPNTAWLGDLVKLDDKGFVLTGAAAGSDHAYATSHPGIFAVGDVLSGSVKRVSSAVEEGSVVMSQVWDFVHSH